MMRNTKAIRDVVAIFAAAMVALLLASYFDAFENFTRWAQSYELWQIDELMVVPIVFGLAFGFYVLRRWSELKDSEKRFRLLAENAQDIVYRYRLLPTPGFEYVSPSATAICGYTPEEHYADPTLLAKIVHPEDRYLLKQGWRSPRTTGRSTDILRWKRKDGRDIWCQTRRKHIYDSEGNLAAIEGIVRDVTEEQRAEETLRKNEEMLRQLLSNFPNAVVSVFDRDLRNLFTDGRMVEQMGLSPGAFVGKTLNELFPEVVDLIIPYYRRAFSGETVGFELPMNERVYEVNAAPLRDHDGQIRAIIVVAQNVTERKKADERLRYQALHDYLTGLPNRHLLIERLEEALEQAEREGSKAAVLFVEIDGFKVITDSMGHVAGDELLKKVAECLRVCVRSCDTVARFGGEEFIVLLEGLVEERVAIKTAEQIIEELQREPFLLEQGEVFITPNIGIAISEYTERGAAELLRKADLALSQSTERGADHYECFRPELDARLRERVKLQADLRRALERGEFRLFYQPKVSLENGEIVGMETLIRWEHPERGLLLPAEFVPLAEETGQIILIGQWVLREACRQVQDWQGRYPTDPPLMAGVNISAKQFRQPNLVEYVGATLRESELHPHSLSLEITESAALGGAQAILNTLRNLKGLGVRIEIDDFGKGYSSLSYLKTFPADFLKIDRGFVSGLGQNINDEGIAKAVMELAHTLSLSVVGEGVETGEQLEILREMGCELAQGNYFWRPLPAEAAEELLATFSSS